MALLVVDNSLQRFTRRTHRGAALDARKPPGTGGGRRASPRGGGGGIQRQETEEKKGAEERNMLKRFQP